VQEVQTRVFGLYVCAIFLLISQLEGLWFGIHFERFWWLRTGPRGQGYSVL